MIETVQMLIEDNFLLASLLFVGIYIVSTVFSLPGASTLTVSSGAIFGWFTGGLLSAIGAWVGAMIIFVAVKHFASSYFINKLSGKFDTIEQKIKDHEFKGMLAIRVTPVFPFFAVNVLAGILNVSTRTYMITTAIGMVWSFVFAAAGAGVIELL